RAGGAIDLDPAEWKGRVAAITPSAGGVASMRSRADASPGWRIGQSVRHAKFGIGIIIDAEGRGGDSRVQVNFRGAGATWLAAECTQLRPPDSAKPGPPVEPRSPRG